MSDKYVSFLEQFEGWKYFWVEKYNTVTIMFFKAQQLAQHFYLQYQKLSEFAEIKLGVPLLPIARI